MRRPAHSFVTGLSKPLETRCGLLKAEASCAIVIALPAHNTVPCLDFLHIFLRCAKKGRKVSRGGRFIGVLLTCRGQCLALKAAPCLQEHVVTRTFINLVFKRLGHSMRIDVCCSASCDTEDHHIPMDRCVLTPCAQLTAHGHIKHVKGSIESAFMDTT